MQACIRPSNAAFDAAGPDEFRKSVPIHSNELVSTSPQCRAYRPRFDRSHYTICTSPIFKSSSSLYQAGIDRNRSPETMIAQAILAILLANATATTLYGLRTSKSAAHFFGPVPSLRLKRNTA